MPDTRPSRPHDVRGPEDPLQFAVEQWSQDGQGVEAVLAKSSHAMIARAAFDEAVKHRREHRVTLRQVCRLMAEHVPGADVREEADPDVEAVLAEFGGNPRVAIRALLDDLGTLAGDYARDVSPGFIRAGTMARRA